MKVANSIARAMARLATAKWRVKHDLQQSLAWTPAFAGATGRCDSPLAHPAIESRAHTEPVDGRGMIGKARRLDPGFRRDDGKGCVQRLSIAL